MLIERVLGTIKERRDKVLNGEINCIPLPFKRFRDELPGIEMGKYFLISGASKSGKSQITSYLFLYTPILYAYQNKDKAKIKIFYFPLEETKEQVTLRFISFLLYVLSRQTIRISPTDLKSTNENKILDSKIIELLESEQYMDILNFFEQSVVFCEEKNPTGIMKQLDGYAKANGVIHKKRQVIKDKDGNIKDDQMVFDYYEPNKKDEYVIGITDHVSLLSTENGQTLKQAIDLHAAYNIQLRNRYNYILVDVQQQNAETIGLDAFKANKIRPTLAGLADSKDTGKGCNVMIGVTNPYSFEIKNYCGYDITQLRGNIRFMEIVLNRDGCSNGLLPLIFDGAVNYYMEAPRPDDQENLSKLYELIRDGFIRKKQQFYHFINNLNQKVYGKCRYDFRKKWNR